MALPEYGTPTKIQYKKDKHTPDSELTAYFVGTHEGEAYFLAKSEDEVLIGRKHMNKMTGTPDYIPRIQPVRDEHLREYAEKTHSRLERLAQER